MSTTGKEKLIRYFDGIAKKRDIWKKRNRFYNNAIQEYFAFIIPEDSNVVELGCGTGDLLNAVKPAVGVGIDYSRNMIEIAKKKYPHLSFVHDDVASIDILQKFDYIIMSDLLSSLWDIQKVFNNIRKLTTSKTRIIISSNNYLWEYILKLGEILGLKAKQPLQNWLSVNDIENLLKIEGYEIVKVEKKILLPKYIPILNFVFNKVLANLPIFSSLSLVNYIIARPIVKEIQDCKVSIVIPARNEKGNIENAIKRVPAFGSDQEFIFIEGNSSDNTYEEMLRVQKSYKDKDIKVFKQTGKGKGNAVREAFDKAAGDILMILDADLTTPPEDMPKFYNALIKNNGEFINGCRLVYPMEKEAMRFLNYLGNKFFGWFFSYLLGQKLKDTLCGTKVLFKSDYDLIVKNRKYFGEFDPFGDFDLLFGAAKLNLKITEVIVRYRDREYGSTQISRITHGILLFRMSFFAARKIKFRI
ncbi:Glycosyltransferase [hydrothermal vent metagenome]|uniref:Glycosyltransferase n=1 Tax=hydrothermal vent metagenome TaxID=652676 RepID=A0A3B0TPL7_9ZZZZ